LASFAIVARLSALTRRRSKNAREECWHVHWEDVRVGTITIRAGNPDGTDLWQWSCGFYAGSHPAELQSGTAPTFDRARAELNKSPGTRFARRFV